MMVQNQYILFKESISQKMSSVMLLIYISGEEKCYPPYGCFNNDPPFSRSLVQLPDSPQAVGTKFMLYTRRQKANPDVLSDADPSSVKTSTFDGSKSTIFVVHGYLGKVSFHILQIAQQSDLF